MPSILLFMKNASNKIQFSKVLAEELRKIDIDVYLSDEENQGQGGIFKRILLKAGYFSC